MTDTPTDTDWAAFPPLMTPQQIAAACSISDAQARTNGNRGSYGSKTERLAGRKKLTYYDRANVRAYHAPPDVTQMSTVPAPETSVPMGTGAVSLLKTLASVAKHAETDARNAETIATSAATIDRLVRQNEKLVERVGELERELREASEQWEPVVFGLFRKRRLLGR